MYKTWIHIQQVWINVNVPIRHLHLQNSLVRVTWQQPVSALYCLIITLITSYIYRLSSSSETYSCPRSSSGRLVWWLTVSLEGHTQFWFWHTHSWTGFPAGKKWFYVFTASVAASSFCCCPKQNLSFLSILERLHLPSSSSFTRGWTEKAHRHTCGSVHSRRTHVTFLFWFRLCLCVAWRALWRLDRRNLGSLTTELPDGPPEQNNVHHISTKLLKNDPRNDPRSDPRNVTNKPTESLLMIGVARKEISDWHASLRWVSTKSDPHWGVMDRTVPADPKEARSDWDLGNLEFRADC